MNKTKYPPQQRFNWGFWQGIVDVQQKHAWRHYSHFDKAYLKGYYAGRDSTYLGDITSTRAWEDSKSA